MDHLQRQHSRNSNSLHTQASLQQPLHPLRQHQQPQQRQLEAELELWQIFSNQSLSLYPLPPAALLLLLPPLLLPLPLLSPLLL
jgi:hypothetical protein